MINMAAITNLQAVEGEIFSRIHALRVSIAHAITCRR